MSSARAASKKIVREPGNPGGSVPSAQLSWPDDWLRYYVHGRYGRWRTGANEPASGRSSAMSTTVGCGKHNRQLFVSPPPGSRKKPGETLPAFSKRTGEPRLLPGIQPHCCPDARSTWRFESCQPDCPQSQHRYRMGPDCPGIRHQHMPPTLSSFVQPTMLH